MKLKEWNFDKNLTAKEMMTVVARKEKRARDENKDTVFMHYGSLIPPTKIEKFKRRKIADEGFSNAGKYANFVSKSKG